MDAILKEVHYRNNILTGEKVLVSPHRTQRPWQGKQETPPSVSSKAYDVNCYLCPGNSRRAGKTVNPNYKETFVFQNDFAALKDDTASGIYAEGLLEAKAERGICRVVCSSPHHSLTLSKMPIARIETIIKTWQDQYTELAALDFIKHVQLFENKGEIMGCSNPHPHCQVWAQESIPHIVQQKTHRFVAYFDAKQRHLLEDYLAQEITRDERVIYANESFVVLVPFWAVWPYETMIVPRKRAAAITEMNAAARTLFAEAIQQTTKIYDALFEVDFPYSAGIHQAPTDGKKHQTWHWHMSFYPPLLRSATIKKFMVGYEMFANPQRDITAEQAAAILKEKLRQIS